MFQYNGSWRYFWTSETTRDFQFGQDRLRTGFGVRDHIAFSQVTDDPGSRSADRQVTPAIDRVRTRFDWPRAQFALPL
jgi:hypothetical protein